MANKYLIYRYDSLNDIYSEIGESQSNEYIDSSIFEPLHRFYYKVKAKNNDVTSSFSNFDYGFLRESYEASLDKPVNFEATKGSFVDRIYLTWQGHPSINNYQIYKYNEELNTDVLIAETNQNIYTDTTNLIPLNEYYYKIRAYHSEAVFSEFADISIGYIDEFICDNSLRVLNSDTINYIPLYWNDIKGADSYKIYRSKNNVNNYELISTSSISSYNDFDNDILTTYYYKVSAINNILGESNFSNAESGFRLEVYNHEFTIDDAPLSYPYGVTYHNNYVYMTSNGNGNIVKMNISTNEFEIIYQVSSARGIEIDNNSNLVIAASLQKQLITITTEGEFIELWGEDLGYLREIDIDKDGFTYVADVTNDQIQKYDPDGNLILSWDNHNGIVFDSPWGLECADEQVVTGDRNGVFFFSKDGEYQYKWDMFDGFLVYGIEYHKGYFYLSSGNHIVKMTPEGDVVAKIGLGHISSPAGMAFDEDDNIYTVSHSRDCVYKYSPPKK